MKLTPTASTWSSTCPGPGSGTGTSSRRRASGPPTAWMRMAFMSRTSRIILPAARPTRRPPSHALLLARRDLLALFGGEPGREPAPRDHRGDDGAPDHHRDQHRELGAVDDPGLQAIERRDGAER